MWFINGDGWGRCRYAELSSKTHFVTIRGVDPYGTGGTRPPQYLDRGGHDHECPPQYF